MPTAIQPNDRPAPTSRDGSNTTIRQTGSSNNVPNSDSLTSTTVQTSSIRSSRPRKPSQKVVDNEATESLIRQEREAQPSRRRQSTSSKRAQKTSSRKPTDQPPAEPAVNQLNLRRVDRKKALELCDFRDPSSINQYYPPHKSKGQFNPPLFFISEYHSREAKAKFVLEWRTLSTDQQRAKMEDAIRLSNDGSLMERAVPKAKKTRLDRDREKEYSAGDDSKNDMAAFWRVLDAEEAEEGFPSLSNRAIVSEAKRNISRHKAYKKKAEERKRKAADKVRIMYYLFCIFIIICFLTVYLFLKRVEGLLSGGDSAGTASERLQDAAKKPTRRTTNDPPTKPQHLNDAVTTRTSLKVGKQVLKLAKLQQPKENVDMGEAYASTVLVEMSNVNRTKRNGGGTALNNGSSDVISDNTFYNIIAVGGVRALREAGEALLKAADSYEDTNNENATSPIKVSDHVSLITNQQQFDTHTSRTLRKKATTATEEETTAAAMNSQVEDF